MNISCPECRAAIDVADLTSTAICCPACGATITIDANATAAYAHERQMPQQIDRFVLTEVIGAGAFGAVYKARDPRLDRVVAVKAPRAADGLGPDERDRFLREARSAAQLRHPHIVTIFEVGEERGIPFIVSEFVEGVTLARWIAEQRPSHREAAEIIATLADALHYAHGMGVIHRDVKPSNVIVERPNRSATDSPHADRPSPRLMDFGLAKRDAADPTITVEGQVLGTPAYMSPEQARGEGHRADGRADIYSLGAVLYQLLTGAMPFHGNVRAVIHQVLNDEPRAPRQLDRAIPGDLETICLKAMAKEPAARYATAGEMAADLRRFLRGESIHARRVPSILRAWRWGRRNRLAVALTALTVLIGIGLGAALLARHYSEKHAREAFELARRTLHEAVDRHAHLDALSTEQKTALRDKVAGVVPFYEEFCRLRPQDRDTQRELGRIYALWGLLEALLGEWNRGTTAFEKAHAIFAQLVRVDPGNSIDRDYLAASHVNLGLSFQLQNRMDDAEVQFRRGLMTRQAMLVDFPDDAAMLHNAVLEYDNWGLFLQSTHRLDEAETAFREAIRLHEASRQLPAGPESALHYRVVCFLHLGACLVLRQKDREADDAFETAFAALADLMRAGMRSEEVLAPPSVAAPPPPNNPLERSATLTTAVRRWYVVEVLRKPVDFYQRQVDASINLPESRRRLARSCFFRGMMQLTQGQPAVEAERSLQQSFSHFDLLMRDHPRQNEYRIEAAQLYLYGAILRMSRNDTDGSLLWVQRVIDALASLDPGVDPALTRLHTDAFLVRGNLRFKKEQFASSVADFDAAVRLNPALLAVLNDTILRVVFRVQERIVRLMREQRFPEALIDVELLAKTALATGVSLYEAACVLSKAADAAPEPAEKDRLGARAVAVLREAFRRGFDAGLQSANAFRGEHPLDYMKKDSDLDGLRTRTDYRQWLREEERLRSSNGKTTPGPNGPNNRRQRKRRLERVP